MRLKLKLIVVALIVLSTISCKRAPAFPEAEKAKELEGRLWKAGASTLAAEEYEAFRRALRAARIHELREASRFPLWRRLDQVKKDYIEVLNQGEALLRLVEEKKEKEKSALHRQLAELETLIERLRAVSLAVNESNPIRQRVVRAEILIEEARKQMEKEEFGRARKTISLAQEPARSGRRIVANLFERYVDQKYLDRWKKWAAETIAESKSRGVVVIIVDKLEKTLTVYLQGKKIAVYEVGLGRFSLSDKLHAGDEATPEGKYRVLKKVPNSRYHKALLLNYPNEDDLRQFQEMKKKRIIPPRVGIGGLIEIHGGGRDSLTYGCVAMEDEAMDELFKLVEVGTPVTIVGTINHESPILRLVKEL